ncbi:MAG: tRNA (mo5U34)-methyltransferase [Gammaproteobacteria bacterium]|jgi:tRNA (mo5U34)-methyltransferase
MSQWQWIFNLLHEVGFNEWSDELENASENWMVGHGDYARWIEALELLPEIKVENVRLDLPAITMSGENENCSNLLTGLEGLKPWRKGPFQFFNQTIDTEWRSDFKWDRVARHLARLENRKILDIGCGNGYFGWRMLGHDPQLVLGIEPSVLFNIQFQAVQKYLQRDNHVMLPIGIESMPIEMNWFDTVFSMGVLYHRKSPIDHLMHIKRLLRPGGELCLETLIIEGAESDVLVPEDRYARMRNVWFLPSALALEKWLRRCGYKNVRTVDLNLTQLSEQRTTDWMPFESLSRSLKPDDKSLTVEGLPAPRRAIILANKPE